MKRIKYKTEINASAKIVYNKMLGLDDIKSYQKWTAEFNPTSTYEGSWEKGSKILFVGIGEDGKRGGMVSEILDNIPYKFVSIRHNGLLNGNEEITSGPEIEMWGGGLENYSFEEKDGKTEVTVEIDVVEEYMDYFNSSWPKAFASLKDMIENNN